MKSGEPWLDPQTKEILQPAPPAKIAPPTLPDYSLILLTTGSDQSRVLRAVHRVNDCDESVAAKLLKGRLPLLVNRDLSYHDALLGQFEFVCCDAIAIFIASEVVTLAEPSYLRELFKTIRGSLEFAETTVAIRSIPDTDDGRRFLDQFVGSDSPEMISKCFPRDVSALWKKARIMAHWASRIGAIVEANAPATD